MSPHVRYLGEIRLTISPGTSEREFLESLLGAVHIPIVVVNVHGQVALWNDAFATVHDMEDEPSHLVVGNRLESIIAEFAQPVRGIDWIDEVRKVLQSGVSRFEKRVPLRLGSEKTRPYDVALHAIRRRDGAIVGVALVMEDTSEQVMLEQRLQRIARTTSLANLGASVAHEIRNPLNSIGLNLQRLQERLGEMGVAEDSTLDILNLALDEVKRLERIVKEFLSFSRPPPAVLKDVDPRELLARCMRILHEEARASRVEMRQNLKNLSLILGDPDLLTQAFQNLLLNAIQAATETPPNRGARVEVEGFETADAVAIVVRDSGKGLPPGEERTKVFDLFYSRREGGTGLGLAIANRIIEDHGGSITAENAHEGEDVGGAIFTVYLPKRPPELGIIGPDDERWK